MLIELTIRFDTGTSTPLAERKDMAEFVNYHLSNAAHSVARNVADHFGYECTAVVSGDLAE